MPSSGNIGFCRYKNQNIGLIINWTNHTVESVDCEHNTCGYAETCELYQKYPVGYTEKFPKDN